jgi:hypothetical protein
MMATSKEKAKKEERKAKARSWADRQKQHGAGGGKAFKAPEGYERYELTAGTHKVDVMPFRAGPRCPNGDEGEVMADLEYTVHKIPTPASAFGEPHICKWETWKKPCLVCSHRNTGTSDADLQKQLRPQLRHVFLFNDKPGNAKNRPKIFDIHHFQRGEGFPEKLVDAINVNPEKYDQFSDLENGCTLILTVKMQPMGDGTSRAGITRIDFEPRSYAYPESILDKMPCLDECLVDEDDDALRELLGIAAAGDDEDQAPRKKKPAVEDDEEPAPKKKAVIEDDEDDVPAPKKKTVVEDDDDPPAKPKKTVVEDDEDDAPAPKKKPAAADDDDDVPAPKKKPAAADDDAPPAKKPTSIEDEPTAEQYGLKKGNFVTYKGNECEIVNISGDGTSLTLEDEDGKTYRAVGPDEVKKIKTKDADDAEPAPKKKQAVIEDDDDDPPAKPKKKPAVDDDD